MRTAAHDISFNSLPGFEHLDVTGPVGDSITVEISHDGKRLWVNDGEKCLLRVCMIEGDITVHDARPRKKPRPVKPEENIGSVP